MLGHNPTLEELLEEWSRDAEIDESELGHESSQIPVLHHKWLKVRSRERLRLLRLQEEQKSLRFEKTQFYVDGPTKEQVDKGWRLPPKGKIFKGEVESWVNSDPDVVEMNLTVAYQREMLEVIDDIMKMIHGRNWQIGRAIEDAKFKAGM